MHIMQNIKLPVFESILLFQCKLHLCKAHMSLLQTQQLNNKYIQGVNYIIPPNTSRNLCVPFH